MNLGNTIVQLREQKGIRQRQLAKDLDISQTYLSQIENNWKIPNMSLLEKISAELSTPLPFLFYLSLDEKDISKDMLVHFKKLDPLIKDYIADQ